MRGRWRRARRGRTAPVSGAADVAQAPSRGGPSALRALGALAAPQAALAARGSTPEPTLSRPHGRTPPPRPPARPGVNALFSTAYGNVGSSIYYALGPRRELRAGPHAGGLHHHRRHLLPDGRDLRRGHGDVPRGGRLVARSRAARSTSSGRSSPRGAQMLNYTITIAISAFFVPHYLGGAVLGRRCATRPATSSSASASSRPARRVNVRGVEESAGVNIGARGRRLLHPAAARRSSALFLVFSPETLDQQRAPGRRADLEGLLHRDPGGDDRLHRASRRSRTWPRRPRTRRRRSRRRSTASSSPCSPSTPLLPAVALSALPVTQNADGNYQHAARPDRGAGRLRRRPDPRRRQARSTSAFLQQPGRDLRRPARRDDPVHRDERGHHRRVAARLLDGPAPPDARPAAPAAPEVRHAVDRDPRLRRRSPASPCSRARPTSSATCTRSARCSRSRSRTRRSSACGSPQPDRRRPYRGPGVLKVRGYELPLFAIVGMVGTVPGVHRRHAPARHRGDRRHGLAGRSGSSSTPSTATARASTSRRRRRSRFPRPVTEHEAEYQSVLVAFDVKQYSEGALATAVKVAARRRRGIHVLVTIPVPASSPITAEMPEQELAAQAILEQARIQGGRRVSGHYEKVRPGRPGG